MSDPSTASDEIDIVEAMRITGRQRDTLMRWKRDGKVQARVITEVIPQRQRRILFRRDEIERLAADQPT